MLLQSNVHAFGGRRADGVHTWRGLFLLWLDVEDGTFKFIIVNVSPEPGLLGSATGFLDDEQISRLREMVQWTTSQQIAVLSDELLLRAVTVTSFFTIRDA